MEFCKILNNFVKLFKIYAKGLVVYYLMSLSEHHMYIIYPVYYCLFSSLLSLFKLLNVLICLFLPFTSATFKIKQGLWWNHINNNKLDEVCRVKSKSC